MCAICSFTQLTTLCSCYMKNALVFSQSDAPNFLMHIISYQNTTSWWNIMKLKLKYQTLTNWHDLRNTNIQYVLCYFQTDKQYQCAWFDVIPLSLAIKSAYWGKNSIRIPNRQKVFVKIYFYSWVEVVHSRALTTQSRRNPCGKKVFAVINKGCHAWN